MLFNDNLELIQIGASGIALLMIAALITHIRLKSEPFRMLPSFALLSSCLAIVYMSNQLLASPHKCMTYLGITIQILLFLVFAVGGTIPLFSTY